MTSDFEYDVALSFAGEDREYVECVALALKNLGIRVFYDRFEEAKLWGQDLYEHLNEIYQNRARFTVMFISANYARKLWTTHERKAAQARAFREDQYILPACFDDTEIPGILPTLVRVSLEDRRPQDFAALIVEKLKLTEGQGAEAGSGQLRRIVAPTPEKTPSRPPESGPNSSRGDRKRGFTFWQQHFGRGQIAVDLGSSRTRIVLPDVGVALDEPSVIAVEANVRRDVKGVGRDIVPLLANAPKNVEAVWPVRARSVTDMEAAAAMLKRFLLKVRELHKCPSRFEVVISVPVCASKLQRRAYGDLAFRIGATRVSLVNCTTAAALGAEPPVFEASGSLLVDLGAGAIELAMLSSFGDAHLGRASGGGGDVIDDAIVSAVRRNYSLVISKATAEGLKTELGTAKRVRFDDDDVREKRVLGRDLVNAVPRERAVTQGVVSEITSEFAAEVIHAVRDALEKASPEHSADMVHKDIVLTGGLAQLEHLADEMRDWTGLSVAVAKDPVNCVARGLKRVLEESALQTALQPYRGGR